MVSHRFLTAVTGNDSGAVLGAENPQPKNRHLFRWGTAAAILDVSISKIVTLHSMEYASPTAPL